MFVIFIFQNIRFRLCQKGEASELFPFSEEYAMREMVAVQSEYERWKYH